ncbi:hypothetical protein SDRG_12789 [Saprolegnia diclina VS20]|uniref:T-complex protein 11 n=1 Tax=Saprolegnia diclina (strain VS20) TaxID=1156394 RepID=T0PVL9_SAPDV|nr:hypothetical protein SDRG_12789 [Saprolegnia diclina VS20]EQC29539.1 hypothetical protein SDRG_12789 [Saprolegnia diclina VS20]|eukprot:XP_008617091.1 hypothetical protein SDRG_12789 [Saprolegnia diclina VS20]
MKSSCQLRLEQRCADGSVATDASEKLQAMWDRISEARRKRRQQLSHRRQTAQSHVSKAISVARAVHLEAQARADDQLLRIQSRLEAAEQRRLERLNQTAQNCQQRNEHIMSTLQHQADRLIEKRQHYDASLHAAHHRRTQLTTAYVSKLSRHALRIEQHKRERVHARQSQAATQLQTWFRSWKHVRQAFSIAMPLAPAMQTVISAWSHISNASFEKSMELVQNRKTAAAAHVLTKALSPVPMSYRVLLMAGMFAHHPADTMVDSQYSAPLACAASRLTDELAALRETLKVRSLVAFAASWKRWEAYCLSYQALFNSWKANDAAQLDADMLTIYAEVYAVHLAATRTGSADVHDKSGRQMAQLRASMEQSFGPTVAASKLAKVESSVAKQMAPKTPPPTEAKATPPSSPIRKPLSKPDLGFTKEVFANDRLAHELILNPNYQIPSLDDAPLTLHATVAQTMRQAFWDQLAATRDRARIVGSFVDLRDQLTAVLKHKALATALPTAHLEALASSSSWDEWATVLQQMLRAILHGEAPARTSSTHAWLNRSQETPASEAAWVEALVRFLQFGFAKVDEIQIDSMNAHLKLLAPYVARHGVEHEQKKFALKLEQGATTLAATSQWLTRQLATAAPTLRDALTAGDRRAYRSLVQDAFVGLVTSGMAVDTPWPETLELDKDRVRDLRNQMDVLTMQACLVTLIQGALAPHHVAYAPKDAAAFCDQIRILAHADETRLPDLAVHASAVAARVLGAKGQALDTAALERRAEHMLDPANAVYKLFFQRVTQALTSFLQTNEMELHPTLSVLAPHVTTMVQAAAKLARHNEAVHCHYYNRLIREAL